VSWIGHSWSIRRDPRDTHRDEVSVKEIGGDYPSEKVSFRESQLNFELDELNRSTMWPERWSKLWPETGKGWKNEWHSFSLALDNAGE
jgi:hypothetical protein